MHSFTIPLFVSMFYRRTSPFKIIDKQLRIMKIIVTMVFDFGLDRNYYTKNKNSYRKMLLI